LVHLARRELPSQLAMRLVIFRDHHQTAGGAVEAVYDSRPQLSTHRGERAKMMQESIHQSAAVAGVLSRARSGMHHHSSRLFDDREIAVFVNNVERYLLSHRPQRLSMRRLRDRDFFSTYQPKGSERCASAQLHLA